MANELRIGLVGAGRHGRYLAPFAREAGAARLVAVADPSEEARARAAADCGFERAYADYRDLLAMEDLDAVLVATPHSQLRPVSLAAIAAGRHVFAEKPLGLNLREGVEVVAAAREAGVCLQVGYCQRFLEVRTRMKALIERGGIGEITAVVAGKGCEPLTGWLAEAAEGGQLLFLGSHLTDQVLWLVGSPVERVYAEMTRRADTGADETTAYTLRFAGGVRGEVLVSQRVATYFDYVEVMGSAGRVRAEWPTMMLHVHSLALPEYDSPTAIRVVGDSHKPMYVAELAEFLSAIREGREPSPSGDEGLKTLAVLDAVFESARTGQPVDLGGALPLGSA